MEVGHFWLRLFDGNERNQAKNPAGLQRALEAAHRFDTAWGSDRPLTGRNSIRLIAPGDTARPAQSNHGPTGREVCSHVLADVAPPVEPLLLVIESWSKSGPDRPTRFIEQVRWRRCEAWGLPESDHRPSTLYVTLLRPQVPDFERVLDLATDDSICVHMVPMDLAWFATPHYGGMDVTTRVAEDLTRFRRAAANAGLPVETLPPRHLG
jgi:hypothetical protein